GGHTQIVRVDSPLSMEVIGSTRDDAVGEAFDKCAKIMGLPYPGGPLIDRYAKEGDPEKFKFPPTDMPGLDYSFSGIKTAFLYYLRDQVKKNPNFIEEEKAHLSASIQKTLVDMLMAKLKRASKETGINRIAIAGGVSANSGLRDRLEQVKQKYQWDVFIPAFQYCTDNAGMIAMAAHFQYVEKEFCDYRSVPQPRMQI
ncbi:MAG: tRNA (adenosine(37)-N6)-threonylcarbamoyltransferase complex transferase subunit TsaD, partial [Bacteroidota bacterium]